MMEELLILTNKKEEKEDNDNCQSCDNCKCKNNFEFKINAVIEEKNVMPQEEVTASN